MRTPSVLEEDTMGKPLVDDEAPAVDGGLTGPPLPTEALPSPTTVPPGGPAAAPGGQPAPFAPFGQPQPGTERGPTTAPGAAPLFQPREGLSPGQSTNPNQPVPPPPGNTGIDDLFRDINFESPTTDSRSNSSAMQRRDRARQMALRHLATRGMVARRNDAWYRITSSSEGGRRSPESSSKLEADNVAGSEPTRLSPSRNETVGNWQPVGHERASDRGSDTARSRRNPVRAEPNELEDESRVSAPKIVPTAAWADIQQESTSIESEWTRSTRKNPLR